MKKLTQIKEIKNKLILSHGKRCGYCGIEMTINKIMEIDLYLPLCKYPKKQIFDNYILSCPICNRIKGSKSPISDDGKKLILHPYKDNYWNEIKINEYGIAEGKTESAKSTIDIMDLNRPELVSYRINNIGKIIETINDGSDAYKTYLYSIQQIKNLLHTTINNTELKDYHHRMIYANIIASMEAYLSKTIISTVLNNNTIFWNFVEKFDWNNEKIDMKDLKRTYDNINIKVQTKLADILYHNLSKVRSIYEKILNIKILENSDEMAFLSKSVSIRHDIVHRNGRKNNNINKDDFHKISFNMINILINNVNKLIDNINSQMKDFNKN